MSHLNKDDSADSTVVRKVPIDHGWAWMSVVGCFMVNFLVVGTAVKSFGILFVEFQEKFDTSSGATVSVVAVTQSLCLLLGPFANVLAMKISTRIVVILGGLLIFSGFVLTMFAEKLIYVYFTYGLLIGVGGSFAYSPSIVMVGQYFSKRRAFANGLAVAGSGVGNFLMPPFIMWLIDSYGSLSGALLILGGLMLNICVAGALLRPLSAYSSPARLKEIQSTSNECEDVAGSKSTWNKCNCDLAACQHLFDFKLFKSTVFLLYAFSVMFMFSGYPTLYVMIPDHAKHLKIEKTQAALLVSILGLMDLIGRIAVGFAADFKFVEKRYLFTGCTAMSGITICFIPLVSDFISLAILCGLAGLFAGGFFALIAVMLAEKLGIQRLHSAFGLAVMFMGLSFLFAAPISGILKDQTGSWNASFLFSGFAMLCGSFILLFDPLAVKYDQKSISN